MSCVHGGYVRMRMRVTTSSDRRLLLDLRANANCKKSPPPKKGDERKGRGGGREKRGCIRIELGSNTKSGKGKGGMEKNKNKKNRDVNAKNWTDWTQKQIYPASQLTSSSSASE